MFCFHTILAVFPVIIKSFATFYACRLINICYFVKTPRTYIQSFFVLYYTRFSTYGTCLWIQNIFCIFYYMLPIVILQVCAAKTAKIFR